ncbi:hypothetical protein QBC32DRAFT_326879 [Pseudoneurospora amorphoporcata]|uniref:Uncharacterized protein n=1 Tax=Pseudoneurospora amorphoporcata TaxID=241081 RepID=A0AAN6NR89_9PEZI|nr:hypothetical protein QBC32DRAFT_326879 [Pseudoneurospora amorphoporcata]
MPLLSIVKWSTSTIVLFTLYQLILILILISSSPLKQPSRAVTVKMKFSTTLVATFASLSVAAPAGTNHKRQTQDTSIPEVLPGLTGEDMEPVEDTTTTSSSSSMSIVDSATADALAAANPNDIYAVPPPTTSSFVTLEENDFTGIQGVPSIQDDDHDIDIVDAAISNLSGTSAPIPLTTDTPTAADDVFSTLDFADDDDQDDTDIEDLNVNIPPIPLSTGTATTSLEDGDDMEVLTADDVTVDDDEAQAMIDAAVLYAQQFPSVPLSTGTGTPSEPDPYMYLGGNATVFGNSSVETSALDAGMEDGTASTAGAAATTVDGTDLIASLQALNDALAAYQSLGLTDMDASMSASSSALPSATTTTTDTDTDALTESGANTAAALTGSDALAARTADVPADLTLAARKIKMLGEDMLSGIQGLRKRAEMAEQENKKMKKKMNKVLNQRGGGVFANKTTTSKTVMDKMGKGVLERYVNMVGGGN